MAMRAIADGRPLGLLEYFAYGEYPSTDAFFDVDMWGEPGVVHEKVTRCPWADIFAQRGLKDCGDTYCRDGVHPALRRLLPLLFPPAGHPG